MSRNCGVSSVSSLMLVKFNVCSYLLLAEAAHPHSLINVFAVFLKTLQRRCNDVVCLLGRL